MDSRRARSSTSALCTAELCQAWPHARALVTTLRAAAAGARPLTGIRWACYALQGESSARDRSYRVSHLRADATRRNSSKRTKVSHRCEPRTCDHTRPLLQQQHQFKVEISCVSHCGIYTGLQYHFGFRALPRVTVLHMCCSGFRVAVPGVFLVVVRCGSEN